MKTIYHYHAIYQPATGATTHIDGITDLEDQIETGGQFWGLRCQIARTNKIEPEKLTICSLTIIATMP